MDTYSIIPLQNKHIDEIVSWKYEQPYELYNFDSDEDTRNAFMKHPYFVLLNQKEDVIGYYCCGEEATIPYGNIYNVYQDEGYIDIGLGLNPAYVSQGFGQEFVTLGLDYLSKHLHKTNFRLSVLESNIRGRKLYTKLGFKVKYTFPSNINPYKFIVMTKEAENKD